MKNDLSGKRFTKEAYVLLLCIIFYALNLRAPIVAVGPVLPEISASLLLTPALAGLITGIPLICFSLASMFVPAWAARVGLGRILFYSIVVLIAGLAIRSAGNISFLFLGSAFIGIGITIGNVLMPPFIKRRFPNDVSLVTAIYLAAMNVLSVFAVGFSISVGQLTGLGWRGSIGAWVLISVVAVVLWLPFARKKNSEQNNHTRPDWKLWKSKLAWQISIFMGTQSVIFYVLAAWLPNMLQDWGMAPEPAGWMLSVFQMGQVPMTFLGPILVGRMKKLSTLIWFMFIMLLAGMLLIILWKAQWIVPAVLMIGVSVGLAFAVATMFFVIRSATVEQAAGLSGMAQSVGYFMAACAPPLFGAVFGWTQSWVVPLVLLLFIPVVLLLTGLQAAKDQVVGEGRGASEEFR